jgi:multiple sugar transport system permease protein
MATAVETNTKTGASGRYPSWTVGKKSRDVIGRIATHTILVIVGFLFLLPFIWQLSTSLKPQHQVYNYPPEWVPNPFTWQNYPESMTIVPFNRFFLNTVLIAVCSVLGQVISCSLAGFAFSRLQWWGRNVLFVIMLSTMMLPYHVTLIPQFILFRHLDWVNTLLPLIVPRLFALPFFVFLIRQFFSTIPRDLDDAAKVDGASVFRIYWQIIMPMSKPVLTSIAIFTFNGVWREYLPALIYLNSEEKFTLQLGLAAFQARASLGGLRWELMMAATTIVMLPVLILFFLLQRYFIQGIVVTGVKG